MRVFQVRRHVTNYNLHPSQTVTEAGTSPCQPPSHTTRATTATPWAPTTAPTAAAAAPPVSVGAFGVILKVTQRSRVHYQTAFIKQFVAFHLLSLLFLISSPKYFPHLIIVVKHIIAPPPPPELHLEIPRLLKSHKSLCGG